MISTKNTRVATLMVAISLFCCQTVLAQQDIQWQTSVANAKELARESNKLVLLHFGAEWCRPCQNLERYVFNAPVVVEAVSNHAVAVKVDVDLHKDLVEQYEVNAIPHDVIITPEGRVVGSRRSPKTSDTYAAMMNGLQNELSPDAGDRFAIGSGNPNAIAGVPSGNPGITPSTPGHQHPPASGDSLHLARANNHAIVNPYASGGSTQNQIPQTVHNQPRPTGAALAALQRNERRQESQNIQNRYYDLGDNPQPANPTQVASAPVRSEPATVRGGAFVTGPATTNSLTSNAGTADTQPLFSGAPMTEPQIQSGGAFGGSMPATTGSGTRPSMPAETERVVAQIRTNEPPRAIATIQQPPANIIQNQPPARDVTPPVAAMEPAVANTPPPVQPNNEILPVVPRPTSPVPPGGLPNDSQFAVAPPAVETRTTPGERSPVMAPQVTDQPSVSEMVQESRLAAPTNNPTLGEGVALQGKCPVTLVKNAQWVEGDARYGCIHRGRTYLLATETLLAEFKSNPDKYAPLLAGYDPVIYHDSGILVEGQEEHGVFMGRLPNQRVILFSSTESRERFQASPGSYIETVRQAMLGASPRNIR